MGPFMNDITPSRVSHSAPRERDESEETGERSIRNISLSRERRSRPLQSQPPRFHFSKSRRLLFLVSATLGIVALAATWIVALRPTTVTIVPRAQPVVFDATAHFSAFPAASAPTSTLSYTVLSMDFENSIVLPSEGMVYGEEKARGTITVVNDYSATPVKLVKNTRFQAQNGLVFRTPVDVVVPGKRGSVPGELSITVIADKPGEEYNIAPTARFTLPGLSTNAQMHEHVFARSTEAFSGGFRGERPRVNSAAASAAQAQLRATLEEKVRMWVLGQQDTILAFPDLVRVAYPEPTSEMEGSSVRLRMKARGELVAFPRDQFARMIAQNVSADAAQSSVTIKEGDGFAARFLNEPVSLGSTPLSFSLAGNALLVWNIDKGAIATALAGRERAAFEMIVSGFSGVDEARARIEPFWSSRFPDDPTAIKITVLPPKSLKGG